MGFFFIRWARHNMNRMGGNEIDVDLTHSPQNIFLSGKTCGAFDCYTCGRLGGMRQKRKAKS
jgi:hypothetical protein